jgi:AcrR family transcriptional regulator
MKTEGSKERRSKASEQRHRPRVRDREATHSRLLEASLLVFDRDGYGNAKIEDIAAEAGVSRATFYLHFGSKEAVLKAIMSPSSLSASVTWFRQYERLNALGDFTWQELRDWLREMASWFDLQENRSVSRLVTRTLASEPEFALAWFEADQSIADYLTHYMAKHREDGDVARMRITVLVEAFWLMMYLWKVGRVEVDEDQLFDAMTDVWWSVLRRDMERG